MAVNTNYDIGEAFKVIEDELIDSMMRNLSRHKEWEDDEGFNWNAWQMEQLKSLEEYRIKNREKFSKRFKDINKRIPKLIKWSREQGGADEEADLLENIGKKPKGNEGASLRFFGVQDAKLDALINATTNDLERAEYSVLRRAEDEYRQIIFNSQVYAVSGAGTYAQAVDMATKDFLSRGIQCIEYANGSRHTISDYADMSIRTANKRAYLMGQGERRNEWGEHLVIVNKRINACPKCMKFQGRVFIDDVYSGGTPADGDYPLLSKAIEQGLYHPRCKDGHGTYYEGISEPPSRPTKRDFDEAVKQEEQETKLATAERNVERFTRLAKYSLDPQNKQRYQARADEWEVVAEQSRSKFKNSNPTIEKVINNNESIAISPKSGTIISGGRITDQHDEKAIEWAKSYYEQIRKKSTDFEKIAQRTGYTVEQIKEIKEYLFVNKSKYNELLDSWEYFDEDVAIAHSWQRLAEGQYILPHDLTLLKHEAYEIELKKKYPKMSHDEAHTLASRKFNYALESEKHYADLKKRNKNR